jgi:hypothetical protein
MYDSGSPFVYPNNVIGLVGVICVHLVRLGAARAFDVKLSIEPDSYLFHFHSFFT